jgi:hypothetical protein
MDVKLAAAMSQMVKPKPIDRAKNGKSFLIILAFAAFMQSSVKDARTKLTGPCRHQIGQAGQRES